MTTPIPAGWFLEGILNQRIEMQAADGIKALITLYFKNYTDATSLESGFLGALRALDEGVGGFLSFDLDDLIREAEAEFTINNKRTVRTLQDEED